jgi:SAM-dependent methyltransferase
MDSAAFERSLALLQDQEARTVARFTLSPAELYPCLNDDTGETQFDQHYVYHTGWAARRLAATAPRLHVDLGSSLFFIAIASAFCPIEFYDYRPARLSLDGVTSRRGDLLALPFADASLRSVSCMHVIEHVGLGRYGDPVDYDGDLKAMSELARVVAPGGALLLVVPVGQARLAFNAHRIYRYDQIVERFRQFSIAEFALVTDRGDFVVGASPALADAQSYGCGCFDFREIP